MNNQVGNAILIEVDLDEYLKNPIKIEIVEKLDPSDLGSENLFEEVILAQQTMLSIHAQRFNKCLSIQHQILINQLSAVILATNNSISIDEIIENTKSLHSYYTDQLKLGKIIKVDFDGDAIRNLH